MRNYFCVLAGCLLLVHLRAWGAEPTRVGLTAGQWQVEGDAEFLQYKGVDAVLVKKGVAVLNGLTFRNGTIEFDVETEKMGGGVGFRRRDKDTYEDFYLRPRPNCAQFPDCVQYAPQTHGVLLWDLYPQYQSSAPLRDAGWNHLKLVVSGRRMNVFVNGSQTPSLQVARLEGDDLEGGILLQGPGYFANVTVAADAVGGLDPEPEKDPTADDQHFIRNWQVGPSYELPSGKAPTFAELPTSSDAWLPLAAERGGMMNISRQYGQPLHPPGRSVTWLKTTIASEKKQTKRAAVGWTREIWVFVNGQMVYADKNLYQPPALRKAPDGRCSIENGAFALPLSAGNNEVDIAVANDFYGWAVIMRLDDTGGVTSVK